ncbi:MAG: hypothetical protein U9N51_01800 [Bacteroidota bacterium]|nr:hypothetical protein [Bacteroidota bacterium]
MKNTKTSFVVILFFAFLIIAISCSAPKQIGDTNNYYFENQSLSLINKISFCHANTSIDSSLLMYKNKKNEKFQIRIPKPETYKTYKEMEKLGKISFTAKKHWNSGYIINKESIKEETK